MLALILVSTHLQQATSSIAILATLSRVAWNSEPYIPMSKHLVAQVNATQKQMAASLASDFQQLGESDTHAWPVMQSTVASHGSIPIDLEHVRQFVRGELDPDCSCWREIPVIRPPNIAVSGWVLFGLAEISTPAASAEIKFLIDEQHPDGWWSIFQVERDDPEYASSYATAWALLALQNQLSKNLISGDDADHTSPLGLSG